jgi:hypothetical protein
MDFDVELVECDPVLEVAVETIGFLDQNSADLGMLFEMADHLAEMGSAAQFGGLNVDEFFNDG